MPHPSRRHVLTGAACLCGLMAGGHALAAAQKVGRYCMSHDGAWPALTQVPPEAYARQGRAEAMMKSYLDAEAEHLGDFFGLRGRYILLEAYAGASYDIAHDTIEIGELFLPADSQNFHRTAAIFAHEAAHRLQVHYRIDEQLKNVAGFAVKYVELHADYMAGAYMAACRGDINTRDAFFLLGDLNVDDHHGTGPERFIAFHRGFAEYGGVAARNPNDILAVAFAGVKHVQSLLP